MRHQHLAIGDLVLTASGPKPIRWIGRRRLDPRQHAQPKLAQPVRVSAGAFGDRLPSRDLYLSPRHCVAHSNVLIPIDALINGQTIVQMDWSSVDYFRLELDEHDLVWAEGLQAESYMYGGLRSDIHLDFETAGGPMTLHPQFVSYAPEEDTCLPLAIAGPIVDAAKVNLAARAGRIPRSRLRVTLDRSVARFVRRK